jgi:glycosyltransferase involved in cell wall biosynthesis
MKLSVLIPAYERTCYKLVEALHTQLEKSGEDYEIIVLEDGGHDQVSHIANLKINDLTHCRYERRTHNVGRAAIRNRLADEARGEWLLFIDADAKMVRDDFVRRYLAAAAEGHKLVCGGITHRTTPPARDCLLRWYYDRTFELQVGPVSPQLSCFNFMVERALFMKVRFNESITTYGWEDVLLGVGLKEQGADIYIIDNPLLHEDADKSARFMEKTRESLTTLHTHEHLLLRHTRLGNAVNKIRRWHMTALVRGVFLAVRPLMERQLLGRHPDMRVFAAYKLGYYMSLR